MISETHGIITSKTEVSNISVNGLWLLCNDHEYFLPYEEFPWFRDAPVKHVFHLEEPHSGHLYWPDLDVDLSLEVIQHPERFPLVATTES
ncbi:MULTISPECIES: DUF2442 domain-containing protein [Cyanophyceae]|uniref:DUF2442 domain-containing protein n=1 Tax=Leptolyngbya subtilissima DQ-A4 TaxID=2933933 RepID=A0ABV0K9D0_9CYAN|nr:DUF2442 domain-containing protein [Nodosilinea sp. FACHB-141]MBD2114266.1 DUF2442 domain-containing protein [Nodosilinea sp. FACHB-141]